MKKHVLMSMGLSGIMMANVMLGNPNAENVQQQTPNATVIRLNSPDRTSITLGDLERGAVNDTMETHNAINALSWRAKTVGMTTLVGTFVTLAVYVRLF